jgi:hypothetical protein
MPKTHLKPGLLYGPGEHPYTVSFAGVRHTAARVDDGRKWGQCSMPFLEFMKNESGLVLQFESRLDATHARDEMLKVMPEGTIGFVNRSVSRKVRPDDVDEGEDQLSDDVDEGEDQMSGAAPVNTEESVALLRESLIAQTNGTITPDLAKRVYDKFGLPPVDSESPMATAVRKHAFGLKHADGLKPDAEKTLGDILQDALDGAAESKITEARAVLAAVLDVKPEDLIYVHHMGGEFTFELNR